MRQRICDICKQDKIGWCVDKATIYIENPWIAVNLSFVQDICTRCLPQVIQQFVETLQGKRIYIEDSDSEVKEYMLNGDVKVYIKERS